MATAPVEHRQRIITDLVRPQPKQLQFINLLWQGIETGDPEYILYGGAAGGGKSHILRWSAIVVLTRLFKHYGLKGVRIGLFCETYPALRDRHIDQIKGWPEWLGTWNEQNKNFTLNAMLGGGILSLRNLDDPAKYASAEFAVILVDELTKNRREDFEELRTRKRWPGVPHSPFAAATNPKEAGLFWVRKLWVEHDFSGDLDRNLSGAPFAFIQALASDNPELPPSYYNTLNSLNPYLRSALLEGNWYVFQGQAFPEFSRARHVIPTADIPSTWRRIASHDWGYGSPGHHLWGAVDPAGGVIIYREWRFRGIDPQDIAAGVLYRQSDERITATYADPAIWQERKHSDLTQDQINLLEENGKLQLSKFAQYREAGLVVERANNARVAGKQRIHTLLKDRPTGIPALSPLGVFANGAVPPPAPGVPYLRIMDSCTVLISQMENIQTDPNKGNEDVITEYADTDSLRDDAYDALRYMLMGIPTQATEPPRVGQRERGSWSW